jgi:predicted GNAT family acetyltransferase
MDDPRDDAIDEAGEESFPASDPPANTVETGIRATPLPAAADVSDNTEKRRLEIRIGEDVAFLDYRRTPETFTILHTEVPPQLRGQQLGELLVRTALGISRDQGLRTVVICPFARAFLRRHPELRV